MYVSNKWPNPGGIPRPPTPRRRPDQKSPQVEATTCRSPGSVDWPGFIFGAAIGPSEILIERRN
jgi:hypothetical protein